MEKVFFLRGSIEQHRGLTLHVGGEKCTTLVNLTLCTTEIAQLISEVSILVRLTPSQLPLFFVNWPNIVSNARYKLC